MLETIYSILALAIVIIALIFLILITVDWSKKSYSNIRNIKIQISFSSILCILLIFKIVIALILAKSLGIDILCAIIWAICTVTHVLRLKDAKGETIKDKKSEDEIDYL